MRYIFRVPRLFRNIFRAFRREKYKKIKEREKYIHNARVIDIDKGYLFKTFF